MRRLTTCMMLAVAAALGVCAAQAPPACPAAASQTAPAQWQQQRTGGLGASPMIEGGMAPNAH